ncbi:MAG: hypothetical protein ACI9FR_001218 [Cryomorphaceae bacterium]|jgi:hypothetical protein
MKSSIRFLTGVALFGMMMASANAQVACNSTQCTGPASELIESIFPRPEGGTLISAPAVPGAIGCTSSSGGTKNVLLPDTHPNYKETYAALLTASVAGNSVQLRVDTENLAECTLLFARFYN